MRCGCAIDMRTHGAPSYLRRHFRASNDHEGVATPRKMKDEPAGCGEARTAPQHQSRYPSRSVRFASSPHPTLGTFTVRFRKRMGGCSTRESEHDVSSPLAPPTSAPAPSTPAPGPGLSSAPSRPPESPRPCASGRGRRGSRRSPPAQHPPRAEPPHPR